jgi:hypothetical protein
MGAPEVFYGCEASQVVYKNLDCDFVVTRQNEGYMKFSIHCAIEPNHDSKWDIRLLIPNPNYDNGFEEFAYSMTNLPTREVGMEYLRKRIMEALDVIEKKPSGLWE